MSKFRFRGKRRRQREPRTDRIPLRAIVPNLITSLAACSGIASIALSSEGRFVCALWALLVACICDGVDGRVARALKASSKLGAELDSLADFVNFGVAPAMFMFFWLTGRWYGAESAIVTDPRIVRVVLGSALYYAICDCFRLARFNTMLEQPTVPYWKHYFTGVPAPGGCWMVLTPVLICVGFAGTSIMPGLESLVRNPWFGSFMMLFVGSLMASRIPTISLKALHVSRGKLWIVMAFALMLIASLFINFWATFAVIGLGYILTVPVVVMFFISGRAKYEREHPEQQ